MRKETYQNFAALRRVEVAGVDYAIRVIRRRSDVALVAPHGGGIEPGTSEIAAAIAGETYSLYRFEGLRPAGNGALHITSAHFDEPECLALIAMASTVVTVHGCKDREPGDRTVYVGGLDETMRHAIGAALAESGFAVALDTVHPGRDPRNVCNRGRAGRGVQLEIALSLRHELLACSDTLRRFVAAIRGAIGPHTVMGG